MVLTSRRLAVLRAGAEVRLVAASRDAGQQILLDALRALPHDAELFASDARLREAGYRPADEVWPGRDGEPSGLREEL